MGEGQEQWWAIPEFPRYEASSLGRIRLARTGRVRKPHYQAGRLALTLPAGPAATRAALTTRNVGALVLMAFVGPRPEGAECSHLNGDHTDNRPENLAWESRPDNLARKEAHGTAGIGPRGELNGSARLTETDVRVIRERLGAGERNCDLADEYGVDRTHISKIRTGAKWRHNQ